MYSPISVPMWSPSLIEISQWRDSSQHWRAMSSLSWNGASLSSKSKQVRPAPSSAWISPTKMPCISERERSAAAGRSVASLAGPVLRCGDLGAARIEDAVLDLGADEALVTGELGLGEHLLHATATSCDRFSQATGTGDPARRQYELLELLLAAAGSLDLFGRIDQRLEEHLAVAPVLELVLQDERERPDRRRVGDPAGAVEVVRVRRDEARDQHPVDADELLDRELRRLGLADRVHERDERVVRRAR